MKTIAFALALAPALVLAQGPAPTAPVAASPAAAAAPPVAAPAEAPAIAVADVGVGTGVEGLELVGAAASFPASVGRVYCWTRVTGGAGGSVTHVWSFNGEKVSEVTLPLRFDSVRTYSYRRITPDAAGAWKVDVLGPDGALLRTVEFVVAD